MSYVYEITKAVTHEASAELIEALVQANDGAKP